MMEWFDFKGTVSGSQYVGRSVVGIVIFGILLVLLIQSQGSSWDLQTGDWGELIQASGWVLFLLIGLVWLSFSTTNKRLNSFARAGITDKTSGWIIILAARMFLGNIGLVITEVILIFINTKREYY